MLNVSVTEISNRNRQNNTTAYAANSIIGNSTAESYWKFTGVTQGGSKGAFIQQISLSTHDTGLMALPNVKVILVTTDYCPALYDGMLLTAFASNFSMSQNFAIYTLNNIGVSTELFTTAIFGDINLNTNPMLNNFFTYGSNGLVAVLVTPYAFTPIANSSISIAISSTIFK